MTKGIGVNHEKRIRYGVGGIQLIQSNDVYVSVAKLEHPTWHTAAAYWQPRATWGCRVYSYHYLAGCGRGDCGESVGGEAMRRFFIKPVRRPVGFGIVGEYAIVIPYDELGKITSAFNLADVKYRWK